LATITQEQFATQSAGLGTYFNRREVLQV